ncbi:Flagellar biosynthesis protein FlhF [Sporomusa acidovorans DSM 3132]|uniref:Flagellar biosynthesis protein FlhF n=2 Tax=Sporomusa TaxID=2375 RepID=A0ABZ3J3F7_SPOA4|nr:flagellar biosynthesis protein FlhF [Sporomusa acidovorans DSM 3132]SDD45735.1 flagellar biosynthesis protein FlhF [Sporomusa acidovorans]
MAEAMAQVKQDLGRDAVILHTRRLKKGGILGFFGREMVEVMAAVDTAPVKVVEKKPPMSAPISVANPNDTKITALQLEMSTMRRMLEQMMGQLPEKNKQSSPLMDVLLKNDVDPAVAADLMKGLPDENSMVGDDAGTARNLLIDRIANCLTKINGIDILPSGCKAVALIGPTGVGKTTTIAKLAANFALKEGYKVALVTADTYRIAAVEQLKTYADIIGVPLEIVYSPDELKTALFRHEDKHLVLIDTAGRSPGNHYQLAELQALLAVNPYIETHLVLNTATKYRDALEIVNKFSICSPQKFLFTKVDEASNLGTILNLVYHFPTYLSYLTTGQSVPDDIELIDSIKLANMILRD